MELNVQAIVVRAVIQRPTLAHVGDVAPQRKFARGVPSVEAAKDVRYPPELRPDNRRADVPGIELRWHAVLNRPSTRQRNRIQVRVALELESRILDFANVPILIDRRRCGGPDV